MEAADLDVLAAALHWLDAGHAGVLVTVVRTWGSSPRPPGALMAIRADGVVTGSVSGGCIEDELIARVRDDGLAALCPAGLPAVATYGVSAEEAQRFGLPCGGTLQLVLEPLGERSRLAELIALLRERRATRRELDLSTGAVSLRTAALPGDDADTAGLHDAATALPDALAFDGRSLAHTLGPRLRLIVIGAGQLSRYLCTVATGLGFDITVCDPREEYRADWQVPGVTLSFDMPDDVVIAARPDERTAVVALTHDPKLDDLALIDALRSPAFYVGALGSRANNARRRERLATHFGLTDAELARLRGPAGLYIGSRTPPEIALSILAEIVAVKNGVPLAPQLAVGPAKSAREADGAAANEPGVGAGCGIG
ncbi:XdhC family protein [Derxia gummosa]|uniref:XdhC family protein n=1 Tax=Derxia gummosa DSM 723 TaxID=1121388 RepID=A0A8B6X7A1_9BURK|nr:XdhC family protein [Derxia gummosa]